MLFLGIDCNVVVLHFRTLWWITNSHSDDTLQLALTFTLSGRAAGRMYPDSIVGSLEELITVSDKKRHMTTKIARPTISWQRSCNQVCVQSPCHVHVPQSYPKSWVSYAVRAKKCTHQVTDHAITLLQQHAQLLYSALGPLKDTRPCDITLLSYRWNFFLLAIFVELGSQFKLQMKCIPHFHSSFSA